MNKFTLGFMTKLAAFTAVLIAAHYAVFLLFFKDTILYIPIWFIYLFNAALVLIVFGIIKYKVNKGSTKAYNLFLILTMSKMALAIVFLIPLFMGKSSSPITEVFNFFIPYFLYLSFEIISLNNFFKNQ